jgi:hypothetical protein
MAKIGIAMVHYRDRRLTLNALTSLLNAVKESCKEHIFGIIVIDNSSDLEYHEVMEIFEQVFNDKSFKCNVKLKLFKPSLNIGYAGACALAARYFIHKGFKYMLCCNNDVFFERNSIVELLRAASMLNQAFQEWGVLQPLVLKAFMLGQRIIFSEKVDSLGLICDWTLSNCFNYSNWPLTKPPVTRLNGIILLQVPVADGMAFLVDLDSWRRIGGMDPDFFLFNEDVLLSLKMRAVGLRNFVVLNAKVYHIRGGVIKGELIKVEPIYTSYYTFRNSLLTLTYIHDSLYVIPAIILNILTRAIKTLFLSLTTRNPLHIYYSIKAIIFMLKRSRKVMTYRLRNPKYNVTMAIKSGEVLSFRDMMKLLLARSRLFCKVLAKS